MSEEFSAGGFAYKLRTQFSFMVDDPTLSCILNSIAGQSISITGYFQTKPFQTDDNNNNYSTLNLVRLTVGSPDAETTEDLTGVRNALNSLGIKFQEKPVIQVLLILPGIPGIINGIFGALWCKVTVNAFYIGEETRLFIDVSDVCKALLVLSEVPLKQCPRQCAPNCALN
ncbi:MAG: hypothetical protein PVH64_12325 [Bacillota bacterium]|jgi:hypothetical protein